MKTKPKTTKLLLYILLVLFLFQITLKHAQSATIQNANILLPSDSSLAFQNDIENYLTLSIVDGILNLTDFNFHLDSGGGYFKFTTPDPLSIKITYSNLTVKVAKGNEPFQIVESGSIISVTDQTEIIWDVPHEIPVEPLLPMMFIFGMVGLGAMIVGPLYAINKIKKREYLEGFRTGIVVTVIGLALFIAWLW